jgi:uncharacterized protein (DUF885 family)
VKGAFEAWVCCHVCMELFSDWQSHTVIINETIPGFHHFQGQLAQHDWGFPTTYET